MKFKFNLSKLTAFTYFIGWLLSEYEIKDMADKLLVELISKIHDKAIMRVNKCNLQHDASAYIKIDRTAAMALYIWYMKGRSYIPQGQFIYETGLVDGIIRDIDKEYA